MKLTPTEADIVRWLLLGDGVPGVRVPDVLETANFIDRLQDEAPPLGEHVFHLECMLGSEAAKIVNANTRERRELREKLGVKRLGKGQGPSKPHVVVGHTMNEYNALDPWKKGQVRDDLDAEIARLKHEYPKWDCGITTRTVMLKGKPKERREGGRRRAAVVHRYSSVRPDEDSVDAHMGGKIPIDRLVQAAVLRGDSNEWLVRWPMWTFAPPGSGKIVIDIYETVDTR